MATRRRLRPATIVLAACLLAASAAAGCGLLPSASSVRDLHVENGTTRAMTVLVDGVLVATVAAGQSETVAEGRLPAGVWSVEARLPGGTTVLRADVDKSRASQTDNSGSGSGARVDLSCGRLDIWVGVPMLGPAPGPGAPGDCDG